MKFAIRLLNQFGEDPRAVYNVLQRRFTDVEVHEETEPYLHYHCMVEAEGLCLLQVKKIMYGLKRFQVNQLVRNRNNMSVELITNEPKYKEYMNKQKGRSWNEDDSLYEMRIEMLQTEDNTIDIKNMVCEFTD